MVPKNGVVSEHCNTSFVVESSETDNIDTSTADDEQENSNTSVPMVTEGDDQPKESDDQPMEQDVELSKKTVCSHSQATRIYRQIVNSILPQLQKTLTQKVR